MPMGPVELADQVGLDICLAVADLLAREPGPADARGAAMAARQGRARGELGRKAGKGLYDYDDDGKPKKDDAGRRADDGDGRTADPADAGRGRLRH